MDNLRIADFTAEPLDAAMNEPFEIATGTKTEVRNVLVSAALADGTRGYGEAAPPADSKRDGQAATLALLRKQKGFLVGKSLSAWRPLLQELDHRLGPARGPAKAAASMALLDAWARSRRIPLRALFGSAGAKIFSDVTVTMGSPASAEAAARRIVKMGVRTIKIKVGRDVDEDLERVLAVTKAGKKLRLMLDANCGYEPKEAIALARQLKRRGIIPVLYEQPAQRDDWQGLSEVHRFTKIPVAADESVAGRADAAKMAKLRSAQVVNIKLMKCGLLEAWDVALICRAAGLGLMIGGMVESSLAMTCSAHLAAGIGSFDFVDLDTPLWFKKDPMRGLKIARGGLYDLSHVEAGIGVAPGNPRKRKKAPRRRSRP
ncbi:MAG: dipeptide epimerase [Elusimicrobia bacterium]|nr:dipeptide epimerase [Elusimicrobiota bacterium]